MESDFVKDIKHFESQIDWVRWVYNYTEFQMGNKGEKYTTDDVWDKTKELCTYIFIIEKKKPEEFLFSDIQIDKYFKRDK